MLTDVTEELVLAKERENSARRTRLARRQADLARSSEPAPNFPPECCCIKPIIYHNIRVQVPVPQQRFMYTLCGLYLSLVGLIVVNILAAFIDLLFGGSAMQFGLSFLYLLGIPGAWICWYYNIYCAIVYSSKSRQLLGLFGLLMGVGFDAWMAVGVSGFGGCGWLFAMLHSGRIAIFIILLIVAALWTLHGVILLILILRFWSISGNLLKGGTNIYRENIV